MFFSGRAKQLPFFSDYLTALVSRGRVDGGRMGLAGAAMGVFGGLAGAAIGVLGGTGILQMSGPAIAGSVIGLQAAMWTGFGLFYMSEKRKATQQIPNRELLREVQPVAAQMHISLMRRKLHRDLAPTAAALLEEGARQWTRVTRALSTAFWQDPDIAEHWRSIRDHAGESVDRAMLELLLLLQSSFKLGSGPQGWQGAVIDVVEQFGGQVQIERGDDLLPVTFDQARAVLSMMAELADEVEKSSKELISSGVDAADDKLRSRLAMGQTLQELRSIREAENELRQNLSE